MKGKRCNLLLNYYSYYYYHKLFYHYGYNISVTKRPEAPTYLFGENCLSDIIQAALAHRVLKCDVIKMKFLKLWDLSGYSERTMFKRPTCQK